MRIVWVQKNTLYFLHRVKFQVWSEFLSSMCQSHFDKDTFKSKRFLQIMRHNVYLNSLPFPDALSILIFPMCNSINSLQSKRPNPIPFSLLVPAVDWNALILRIFLEPPLKFQWCCFKPNFQQMIFLTPWHKTAPPAKHTRLILYSFLWEELFLLIHNQV